MSLLLNFDVLSLNIFYAAALCIVEVPKIALHNTVHSLQKMPPYIIKFRVKF